MIYLWLFSTLVHGKRKTQWLYGCYSFLPVLCFQSLSHLTPMRCHCVVLTKEDREKFSWLKVIEITAADGSVSQPRVCFPPAGDW